MNGLKREIHKAIRLHKPKPVDMALSLAETQEEMLEEYKSYMAGKYKHEYKRSDTGLHPAHKGVLGVAVEENKRNDQKPPWEDKLVSLRA